MTAPGDPRRLDLRLVPAALTGWAVTAAGILGGGGAAVLVLLGGVGSTAAVACWAEREKSVAAALRGAAGGLLAVAVLGAAFALAITVRTGQAREHPITTRYGTSATVTVIPTDSPRPLGGGRLMFRGGLRQLDGIESSGRVVVFASAARFGELSVGRPATFRAQVNRPNRRDLTVAALSATGEPTLGTASRVQRMAHAVRTGYADAARGVLPADQAAMLPALVLGDTSTVPAGTVADFRAAGLTHLTAVSGANVTIVCGAVLLSAGLIGPRAATVLAAAALVAFVIVVQPSASVLRAAVMGAVTLLAVLSHRRRQAIPALSASVLFLLVAAPELAVDAGFALSVTATAGLVVVAPVWSARLTGRGWPKPVADAVAVAVAAQLVTAPLVAAISGAVSLVGVAANLAVAAVIPPITVVGTAAAALGPFWPAGARLLIRFTGPQLWWLLRVAEWAAAVPGAVLPVPSGWAGLAVVTLGTGAVVALWGRRSTRMIAAGAGVCVLAWAISGSAEEALRAALSVRRGTIGG
ncbi:competence protein [Mycobacterium sp. 852013-51886_SCH5428379]|uniref:ComEC/Rec2 family competence protein n=1 Tax=Mycobacterium sp. 852013-51886_SCH5428379 TaxID=1834111 RepID=UPI0007FD492C|nr:ComEC/Rec2 family competence protein [Mycobacterium sp. 852013-51886_SCH5428379]OBB56092.1 competence protein [Mycobacterium sp. 852013-51886_SCH5428379]